MPRCTTCNAEVKRLWRVEQGGVAMLERCQKCEALADPYVEIEVVQTCLDVFLLRPLAWAHVIHNGSQRAWRVLLALVLVAVLCDVYASAYFDVYSRAIHHHYSLSTSIPTQSTSTLPSRIPITSASEETTRTAQGLLLLQPSLKFVDTLSSPRWLALPPLPKLAEATLYGVLEFVFVTLTLLWGGSWLASSGSTREDPPLHVQVTSWLMATMTMWSLRVAPWAVFMVWSVPLYLVVVVDALSVVWLGAAIRAAAPPRATTLSTVLLSLMAVGTRFAFRGITQWCPLFITADLLMPVL